MVLTKIQIKYLWRKRNHHRCNTESYIQAKQRHNTLTCSTVVASVASQAFQERILSRDYTKLWFAVCTTASHKVENDDVRVCCFWLELHLRSEESHE